MSTSKSTEMKQSEKLELSPNEMNVVKFIYETIFETTKAPTVDEIQSALKKSEDQVVQTLEELEKKDILIRKNGTQEIVSIYPFSLVPTEHHIILEDGKRLFAMCAIDALGMPNMFSRNAKIVSTCAKCKQEIEIEIKNGEIVRLSHPHAVVWHQKTQKGTKAAGTMCPYTKYFCCREHLEEFRSSGETIDVAQEFPSKWQNWKRYGEILGFR
jgi:predicted transcriptional regulator